MDAIVAALLDHGTLGIAIVVLAYALIEIFKRYEKCQREFAELQEKRFAESQETIKTVVTAIQQSTASMDTLGEILRERSK